MTVPLFGREGAGTGASQYLSAKQVADLHRNSDVDQRLEALHHTLGKEPFKSSPGDHSHDGGSSSSLFGTDSRYPVTFTEDLNDPIGLKDAVIKIIGAMVAYGAIDNSMH